MQSVAGVLLGLGGVASRSELAATGFGGRQLAAAVQRGDAHRPRRGWYAHPSADEELVRAIRIGGRMACLTAARSYGLWILDDGRTHVHVPHTASRLRERDDRDRQLVGRGADGAFVHRGVLTDSAGGRLRVSVVDALAQIVGHGDLERAQVALDSAAHNGLLTEPRRASLRAVLPVKYRFLVDELRSESESGIETLVRVRLAKIGIPAALQVRLAEGIRVDLLVDKRLVIETDGREFHDDPDSFERDRRRDLFLKAFGFEVLRLSYRQVISDWASCEAAITRLLPASAANMVRNSGFEGRHASN